MGSQLLLYELSTGHQVTKHVVFSAGIHVHGVHSMQLEEANLLAVHGDRFVKVCQLRLLLLLQPWQTAC